ncbi:MAG: DUF4339 domain-containing protein [Chitinophagaceae bacterium]|nr:DUF4339 domain-containing protein [Chitinophagaceae bacterium]
MKEYLLLRNNKQTGPYSLEELQQMGLKPFDLVWIDKKSCAWRYPSEIKDLAPYLPSAENLKPAVIDSPAQRVVNISSAPALVKTGSDNVYDYDSLATSEKYISHVVALKPTIDNTRIRTIKSNSCRNIVHVQVRDNVNETPATNVVEEPEKAKNTATNNNDYTLSREYKSTRREESVNFSQDNETLQAVKTQPVTDNKLELAVLIIGAVSLLAIVYLLVTSPY